MFKCSVKKINMNCYCFLLNRMVVYSVFCGSEYACVMYETSILGFYVLYFICFFQCSFPAIVSAQFQFTPSYLCESKTELQPDTSSPFSLN